MDAKWMPLFCSKNFYTNFYTPWIPQFTYLSSHPWFWITHRSPFGFCQFAWFTYPFWNVQMFISNAITTINFCLVPNWTSIKEVPSSYVLTPNFCATMGSLTLVAYIAWNLDGALGVENKWEEGEKFPFFEFIGGFSFHDYLSFSRLVAIDNWCLGGEGTQSVFKCQGNIFVWMSNHWSVKN